MKEVQIVYVTALYIFMNRFGKLNFLHTLKPKCIYQSNKPDVLQTCNESRKETGSIILQNHTNNIELY